VDLHIYPSEKNGGFVQLTPERNFTMEWCWAAAEDTGNDKASKNDKDDEDNTTEQGHKEKEEKDTRWGCTS
jgi:hypothetical protein